VRICAVQCREHEHTNNIRRSLLRKNSLLTPVILKYVLTAQYHRHHVLISYLQTLHLLLLLPKYMFNPCPTLLKTKFIHRTNQASQNLITRDLRCVAMNECSRLSCQDITSILQKRHRLLYLKATKILQLENFM